MYLLNSSVGKDHIFPSQLYFLGYVTKFDVSSYPSAQNIGVLLTPIHRNPLKIVNRFFFKIALFARINFLYHVNYDTLYENP